MKFVNVTYGTHGEGKQYTYVVNDNVKKGDVLQPSVIHYQSQKVFGTTGIAQNFPDSVPQNIEGKTANILTKQDVGVSNRIVGEKGQFGGSLSESGRTGGRKTTGKDGTTKIVGGQDFETNEYINTMRGANITERLTGQQSNASGEMTDNAQKDYESYDEYVGRFKKK